MNKKLSEVKYIIIHHSGVINSDDDPTSEKMWISILNNHRKKYNDKFPWSKAPYHFGIGKKGNIFNGEDTENFCIHAGDDYFNYRSLAVCFLGNFNIEVLDENQLNAGIGLIKDLIKKYFILPSNVLKHNDIVTTDCPGKYFPWNILINRLFGIPQYKYDAIDFALKVGWIKNYHDPSEPIDFGTFLIVLKNFYEGLKNGN
ncbi:MAG: peptidoglycan recognition protein family protein [Caldisericia bacterium]